MATKLLISVMINALLFVLVLGMMTAQTQAATTCFMSFEFTSQNGQLNVNNLPFVLKGNITIIPIQIFIYFIYFISRSIMVWI